MRKLQGRCIFPGEAAGRALKSDDPVGFFGHVDPATGVYREKGHPLDGKSLQGRVLVFPRGKGSTVGSYILYALKKTGAAPCAMVLGECDTIVAVGAIIGEIPVLDRVDLSRIKDGMKVRVRGGEVLLA